MPNQNQSDPKSQSAVPETTTPQTQLPNKSVSQPSGFIPPVISPQSDLPPLPPDFQNMPNASNSTSPSLQISETPTPQTNVPESLSTPEPTSEQTANSSDVQQPIATDTGSAAPPPNIPPMTTGHKKKFGTVKVVATILGLFLLIGGVGAGVILTQQQQLFQQRARVIECTPGATNSCTVGSSCAGTQTCTSTGSWGSCVKNDSTCGTGLTECIPGHINSCTADSGCAGTKTCTSTGSWGSCVKNFSTCGTTGGGGTTTSCSGTCRSAQCLNGETPTSGSCGGGTQVCCKPISLPTCPNTDCDIPSTTGGAVQCVLSTNPGGNPTYCCPSSNPVYNSAIKTCGPISGVPTCSLTGNEICVGNVVTGSCYQGGQGGAYACYKLNGNPGKEVGGASIASSKCTCPAPYTWGPVNENGGTWCFNTNVSCNGQAPYAERCSLQPKQCSTVPPTSNGAYCTSVSTYDTSWNVLSASGKSSLKTGNQLYFCVAGANMNSASFTVNNNVVASPATTKRPGSTDICQLYTITTNDFNSKSLSVSAKVQ